MRLRINAILIVFILLFVFSAMCYIIEEGQQGLLLQLGEIKRDKNGEIQVEKPGLHFRIPFIDTVRIFDTRLQTLDIKSSRIVTQEKKDVLVDYFAKWRIRNLALYFTSTGGNIAQAETLLSQKLNNGLRAEFGKRNISDVVSSERQGVMQALQQLADASAKNLGIEVIDVRIKRIDLPQEVSNTVFDNMRSERESVANQLRSQGKAEAEAIRAQADANATVIIAKAQSQSKIFRGEGDAEAAKIYADAYTKDPDFYAFYRSLDAYQEVFKSKNDVFVLRPDSQFFKYFKSAGEKSG